MSDSPASIDVSVSTMASSAFFSLPSAWARSGSSQIFGSSSSRATSLRRADLTSKSKIPPQLRFAIAKPRQRIGDLVQLLGFHRHRSAFVERRIIRPAKRAFPSRANRKTAAS
jgi:hypothetical protein